MNPFINASITAFYFMYMYLLRTQLDVISCAPVTPDDGHTYTSFTSSQVLLCLLFIFSLFHFILKCGGLCKCWDAGSLQMRLLPFAITAFFVYSVGFVVYLYRCLTRNRELILQVIIFLSTFHFI